MLREANKQMNSGNRLAAITTYQKLLTKQPNNMVASANLGKLLLLEGNYTAARPLLEKSLKFFLQAGEIYHLLVACYISLEDQTKALETIEIAKQHIKDEKLIETLQMELKKTPPRLQDALLKLYDDKRYIDVEIGCYLNLEDFPDCSFSKQMLAAIEHKDGKYEQAFAKRMSLLTQIPKDSSLLAQISESYLALGDIEQALSYAKKALSLSAHNPNALLAHHNVMKVYKQKKLLDKENGRETISLKKAK